jgi:hypothetical protein
MAAKQAWAGPKHRRNMRVSVGHENISMGFENIGTPKNRNDADADIAASKQ